MIGAAGVRGAVGGVREIRENRHQRKELAHARGNDPFSITETPVEKTAVMQQASAMESIGAQAVAGGRTSPSSGNLVNVEEWVLRKERIQASSPYAEVEGWNVAAVIIKADDDLRQEAFCMHMVSVIQKIFRRWCSGGVAAE